MTKTKLGAVIGNSRASKGQADYQEHDVDVHQIPLKLTLPPIVFDDEVKVARQAQIIENGSKPKLDHEALDRTRNVVSVRSGESRISWSHETGKKVRKGSHAIKAADAQDQLMKTGSPHICLFENVTDD